MDFHEKQSLIHCRSAIVEDLDVSNVIDHLLASQVLSVDDKERIFTEETRRAQARQLLDLLPRKGPAAYSSFVASLEEQYSWLVEALDKSRNGRLWNDITDSGLGLDECNGGSYGAAGGVASQQQVQDALLKGGVPQPPPHQIKRVDKIDEITNALKTLERSQFLILHGMSGCGKSVLAAQCVSSTHMVQELFQGSVYWTPIGNVAKLGRDALLAKMRTLIEKVEDRSAPQSVEHATQILRNVFLKENFRNNLLVLDDVWHAEVVRAFDVGCKVMITTRDSSVVELLGDRKTIILIPQGFNEVEALDYISACVGINVDKLPEQARQIYFECKGNPMVITLIGAMLEENRRNARNDIGRWQHYVETLTRRKYSNLACRRNYDRANVVDAIQMSISNLTETEKEHYQDFAVFIDDVNISTKVLMTLWGLNKYDVEDIMAVFVKKSLVVSEYDDDHREYVYGIHDLQLDFLKNRARNDGNLHLLHKKLVEAYLRQCQNTYSQLPNDNYIYLYIGYHLCESQMTHLFPRIFLDLDFVGAKLRATGPSDLLRDYRKYEESIVGESKENQKVLNDFEEFVRMYGYFLVQNEDTDVVQLALRMSSDTKVYQLALEKVHSNPQRFYLNWLNNGDVPLCRPTDTILCGGHVHSIAFAKDDNHIVVAVGETPVKLYEVESGRQQHAFRGHTSTVNCITVTQDGEYLLTASDDETVRVWHLGLVLMRIENNSSTQSELDVCEDIKRTPSPCVMQDSWHDMFAMKGLYHEDTSRITFEGHHAPVNWVACSRGQDVVSAGKDGTAQVWSLENGNCRLVLKDHNKNVTCCAFTPSDEEIGTCGEDMTVKIWSSSTGLLLFNINRHNLRVIAFSFLPTTPDLQVVSLTENQVTLWSIPRDHLSKPVPPGKGVVAPRELSRSKNALYQCLSVSPDGSLLAAGTSDNRVVLWDLRTMSLLRELPWHNGWVTCLSFWSGDRFLLSGSEDETVMTWDINPRPSNTASVPANKLCHFHARFVGNQCWAAFPDDRNRIEVRVESQSWLSAEEKSAITFCCLSHQRDALAYGCEDGSVKVFSWKSNQYKVVGRHRKQICFLEYSPSDSALVSCAESGTIQVMKGTNVFKWKVHDRVIKCFFDPGENVMISCWENGDIKTFDLREGKLLNSISPEIPDLRVICCDFLPEQGLLCLGSDVGVVCTIDLKRGHMTERTHCKSVVRTCRFSPDARLLALGYDNGLVLLWNNDKNQILGELRLHKSWVRDLLFSSDSSRLLTAGDQLGWWNISVLERQKTAPPRKISTGEHRTRRRNRSGESSPSAVSSRLSDIMSAEGDKVGRQGKRELLQNYDLGGNHVSKVHANEAFTRFVSVDDAGIVYSLELIDVPRGFLQTH